MLDFNKFLAYAEECNEHYRSLLEFEFHKLEIIVDRKFDEIDRLLPDEQAFVMKSNALEARREKLLRGTEFEGASFSEIIDGAPDSADKARMEELHEELCGLIKKIKEINDTAGVIINSRLSRIKARTEVNTYDGKGAVSQSGRVDGHTTFKA